MKTTLAAEPPSASSTKGWSIALWIAQILLAGMFGMAGLMKLTMPIPELAARLPWASAVPELLVRFIGLSELAGALGLLLPSLLRIRPQLTALAGWGLMLVMILAIGFHLIRGEIYGLGINAGLGALAAFVAWGRSGKAPIAPRS